jgi:hypothetical protein
MMARSIYAFAFAFAAWLGGTPSDVSEVQITPSGANTLINVVVGSSDISVHHFMLSSPPRLILDVEGARHALDRHSYEAIGRGGVIRMRSSQFQPEVVRLVFDLTRELPYEVETTGSKVEIRFQNPGEPFTTWSTGLRPAAPGSSSSTSSRI